MYFSFRPWHCKEISELYANRLIRTFALGIIYSFLSIYIIVKGFGLGTAVSYFLFAYIFTIFLAPLPIFVAQKIGYKKALSLYFPFTIAFFFFLYTLPTYNWPIFLVSLFFALSTAFYWMPSHVLFVVDGKGGHRGHEIGLMTAFEYIAALFAPLIGALLIDSYGFLVAFLASSAAMVFSLIPLFLTKDIKVKATHSFPHLFRLEKLFEKEFLATGLIYAAMILWPLYVFLHHETFLFVGVISFLAGLGSAVFAYFVGNLCDKLSKNSIMQWGGVITAVLWAVPLFFMNDFVLAALSFCYGFFFSLIDLPLFSLAADEAKKVGPAEFMIVREMSISITRALGLLVMLLFLKFNYVFMLAILASLYFALPKSLK